MNLPFEYEVILTFYSKLIRHLTEQFALKGRSCTVNAAESVSAL